MPTLEEMEERCAQFNRVYLPGTKIKVHPVRGEREFHVRTIATHGAHVLGGHSPVVYVTDGGGSWHLDNFGGLASDEERVDYASARYLQAAHAMQSGVAQTISLEASELHKQPAGSAGATPKHLRVGINSAMVNDRALAELLIAKGVFSTAEYHEALASCM